MIYICGPMSGMPDDNKDKFNLMATHLSDLGWVVYNPVDDFKSDRVQAMNVDLPGLLKCDEIVLLAGWEDSWGATLEARIAWETGMTFYDEELQTMPKETGRYELMRRDIREKFPHGHPKFREISLDELELHSQKNHDYAAGGDPLGNFKRVAAIKNLYPDFPNDTPHGVALNYLLKQLDAVLWGLSKNIVHKCEGFGPRLQDISVYARLTRILLEDKIDEGNQISS